jgi:hypothetical protein
MKRHRFSSFMSHEGGYAVAGPGYAPAVQRETANGRSSSPFRKLNMVEFAPVPNPGDKTATTTKAFFETFEEPIADR